MRRWDDLEQVADHHEEEDRDQERNVTVSLFADGLREALGLRPAPPTTLSPGPLRHSARNEPAPTGRSSSSILLGVVGVVVILGAAVAAFFAMRGH